MSFVAYLASQLGAAFTAAVSCMYGYMCSTVLISGGSASVLLARSRQYSFVGMILVTVTTDWATHA